MSEQALLERIDGLGLVPEIRHIRFPQPLKLPGRVPEKFIIGETICELYSKKDHPKYINWRKKVSKMVKEGNWDAVGFSCPVEPVSYGEAKCSHLDNFCKRTGRVLALVRAWKDIQNTVAAKGVKA